MSEKMATPAEQNVLPPQPASLPDERFWKRYSKHHELPLSSAGSLLIHCIVGGSLILIGVAVFRAHEQPLPLGVVGLSDGGGGGSPPAEAGGPGEGVPPVAGTEAAEKEHGKMVAAPRVESKQELPTPRAKPVELPDTREARPLEPVQSPFPEISQQSRDLREKLLEGLKQGKGVAGPGDGGGRGIGNGPGPGPGTGPAGSGTVSVRQKRLLRWTLIFNTATGDDYRRQLSALGAIVAVPKPGGGYMVIRDLRHTPARGKIDDVHELNRIFWMDQKPRSVGELASALGIRPVPAYIVAFFPKPLEDDLLAKELKYQGLKEEEIRDTTFEVRYEHGQYVPVVIEQTRN